ncbi:MAG: hypothetical protein ACR2ND_09510 [Solirubrobacteraceae bacterium]
MRNRTLAVILTISLFVAVVISGCGSSGKSGSHHRVLKSVGGAVVIHHVLKKRGSHHAVLKSVAGGAVIHHVLKKHGR